MYPEYYENEADFGNVMEDINAIETLDQEAEQAFRHNAEAKVNEFLERPARKQVGPEYISQQNAAYVEGNYDYNIWYDKYLTDRQDRNKRLPALHRCDPDRDSGYTKADKAKH